ncbi:MAG TPA: ferrous iron transporter B [Vicinamibacterales bacterium]|nr:ferrous iron transporter B [Vicinamibacterales bacterium]
MPQSVAAPAETAGSSVSHPRVALVGNPNTGKTTVFNRLCGARAKTANFPGTTATTRVGRCHLGQGRSVEVIDLPGLYRLELDAPEAGLVRDVLAGRSKHPRPTAVVVLADASNLARNLVLVGEVLASRVPTVVCLNMTDVASRRELDVDVPALSARLGVPVVPMVASRGIGLAALREAIAGAVASPAPSWPADVPAAGASLEAIAQWGDRVTAAVVRGSGTGGTDQLTERLDHVLTHPVSGTLVFFLIMGGLFWTLFALATVPMDLIETIFTGLGAFVRQMLPAGPVRDLLIDGVIGGIAGTVVFLPQIMLLFFLISLLEDTGYLARAAFVNDRFFRRFGLPGQAFVPLLSAHACAVPAIMSTRLIPSRRDRLATILVLPFMSCSARLPVYVLLTSLLFASRPAMAGLAFAGCYVLGAAAAFLTAALFGRTVLRGRARPMVLELPSYKWPSLTNALVTARDQGLAFLQTAGTIIFAICVVMWWLSAYPRVAPPAEAVALRAQAAAAGVTPDAAQTLAARADAIEAQAAQTHTFAGRLGRLVQPVFRPLGYDWQLTDGLLTSFVAREVFVSTMSVLAGAGNRATDVGLVERIRTMTRDDGSPVFTRATAASALVFFVLAMQCLATLTMTRREAGGVKYAAIQFAYMSILAWIAALAVFQGLRVLGVH